MMKNPFTGLIVPLVTPFERGGVDYKSLEKIIDFCLENGANGFVALGTTAEAATLTADERDGILEFVLKKAGGAFVIAGAGSNCTREAAAAAKRAETLGANGVLSVCPYYNKPPESGIIAHFRHVAAATELPVILYDVPQRTGTRLGLGAIEKLSAVRNIVGIKQAAGDQDYLRRTAALCTEEFALFGGNDFFAAETLRCGGAGLISAAANALPGFFAETIRNPSEAFFARGGGLLRALYAETNPAGIKYLLRALGLCKNALRLPMCPVSRKNGKNIDFEYDRFKEAL